MIDAPIVNPTAQQMSALKGIIYGFRNKRNGKCYIGKSRKTLQERYSLEWWNSVQNRYLMDDLKRIGYESFEVIIFEHSIEDASELCAREAKYVVDFNAYHPHGYNIAPTGNGKMAEAYLTAIRHRNARTFRFKRVATGEVLEIHNLSEWCRIHGYCMSNIAKMIAAGPGHISQGFTHVDTSRDDLDNRWLANQLGHSGPFALYRGREQFSFSNVTEFMKEHSLEQQSFSELMRGKRANYCGFTLEPHDFVPTIRRRYHTIALKDQNGSECRYTDLNHCSNETGATTEAMRALLLGRTKRCKGYTLISFLRG